MDYAESIVLNSDCKCKILLEQIKRACRCSSETAIDLADMQAVVQKLCDKPDDVYARETIQSRANYVLINATKRLDENGQMLKEYKPLLKGLDTVNPEFINRLSNRKVNPDAYGKDSGKDSGTRSNLRSKTGSRMGNKADSRSQGNKGKGSHTNIAMDKTTRKARN